MGDIPLYRAAEQLGMSTSYLKAACRRLGIARWPRAGRSIGGVVKPNIRAQVNIDYSRRHYRRYNLCSKDSKCTDKSIHRFSEPKSDWTSNSVHLLDYSVQNPVSASSFRWDEGGSQEQSSRADDCTDHSSIQLDHAGVGDFAWETDADSMPAETACWPGGGGGGGHIEDMARSGDANIGDWDAWPAVAAGTGGSGSGSSGGFDGAWPEYTDALGDHEAAGTSTAGGADWA